MNFKKFWYLTICFSLCLLFICLVLPVRTSAYTYYNNDGFITVECSEYSSEYDFSLVYDVSTPVTDSTAVIPSGYILVGRNVFIDNSTYNTIMYVYYPADTPYTLADNDSSVSLYRASNLDIYIIVNRIYSSGTRSFKSLQHATAYNWGTTSRYVAYTPVLDSQGNILRPESSISFDLNTAITDNVLYFNSSVNSGDGGLVTYYIFPSSANIPTGSITPVASGSVADLDTNALASIANKGFDWLVNKYANMAGYNIDSPFPPRVNVSSTSSYRFSGGFNPSSFGLPYEKIGTSPLFPSSGITLTNHLNMADIVNLSGGVYSYSNLKLVSVVTLENRDFVASFDFSPANILAGAPVAPSTISGPAPYPDFGNSSSQFADLADYLKNLFSINNDNQKRNDSNFIAMLGSMPWAEYVGTGFSNSLPNLSMYLDSLFTDLFDKFTVPSDDDINALYADIQAEKNDLKAKLAFVSDVKTEMYFIIATITADNNSVPPNFEVTLPSVLFGGQSSVTVNILSYEIATPYVVGIIKDIITVFLSLSLVVYVWRTLPSTIGNMPRGDD